LQKERENMVRISEGGSGGGSTPYDAKWKNPGTRATALAPKAIPTRVPAATPAPAAKKTTASAPKSSGGSSYKSSGGGGGSAPAAAPAYTPPVYDPMKDPAYLASVAKLNDLWNQAGGYKTQIDDMMKAGFTYDPNSDASYKSLSELASKQAKVAGKEAMETLNDRGILNSTITGDRVAQIEQTAQDAVTAQVPTLQNAAYGRYMDKLNTLSNMWNSMVNQAQAERAFSEDKRRWELGYDMDKTKFNTGVSQWNQEFAYKQAQDSITNAIDRQRLTIQQVAAFQDAAGYKDKAQTEKVLGELLQFTDPAKAYEYLAKNSNTYAQNGVSMSDLVASLKARFPGYDFDGTGGGTVLK
jgi:hypothetical protein